MSYGDPDDEDWYDEEDSGLDEEEAARCPECGAPMYIVTDKCPKCGYWITESDRRVMWSGMSKSRGIKIVAVIVLAIFVLGLLASILGM